MTLYKRLLTPPALAALDALHKEQPTIGTTPDEDLDVIAALVVSSRAKHILQFGTLLGYSAIVLADLAAQNGVGAELVTVDNDPQVNMACRHYAEVAGLGGMVKTIDGSSTDPQLIDHLSKSEWDVIYLDTTHQYSQTVTEIDMITALCGPTTLFIFHDASQFAADTLDTQHQGGVRRAMREWCLTNPRWQCFIFERPAFGEYGIGVMQKKATQ